MAFKDIARKLAALFHPHAGERPPEAETAVAPEIYQTPAEMPGDVSRETSSQEMPIEPTGSGETSEEETMSVTAGDEFSIERAEDPFSEAEDPLPASAASFAAAVPEDVNEALDELEIASIADSDAVQECEAAMARPPLPYRPSPPATRIIAVVNQKGGVGKTTTSINLAAALSRLGNRVLLVDADPQGNVSCGLGIDKKIISRCIYNVLIGEATLHEVLVGTSDPLLNIIPATVNLAGAEIELVALPEREYRLAEALQDQADEYDYIVIDCPPSLGIITINALAAASEVLIPVQCEFFAMDALARLYTTLDLISSGLNPFLQKRYILISMFDGRIRLNQQVRAEIRSYFGATVLQTEVPRAVRLGEAPGFGQSILEYDKQGALADIYLRLAGEVSSGGR